MEKNRLKLLTATINVHNALSIMMSIQLKVRRNEMESSWVGCRPNTNLGLKERRKKLSPVRHMNSSIMSPVHVGRQHWFVYVLPLFIMQVFKDHQHPSKTAESLKFTAEKRAIHAVLLELILRKRNGHRTCC